MLSSQIFLSPDSVNNMAGTLWIVFIGFIVRFCLMFTSIRKLVAERIEVSTPLNAWRRVTEGVYLQRIHTSPYDGDVFHEPPLLLWLYNGLGLTAASAETTLLPFYFSVCDVLTAVLLGVAAKKSMEHMVEQERRLVKVESAKDLFLTSSAVIDVPQLVMTVYLLSPYSIVNCVGMATTVFSNLLIALSFACTVYGHWVPTAIALAIETYKSFYPMMLLVPALLYFTEVNTTKNRTSRWYPIPVVLATISLFASVLMGLLYASYCVCGSWSFIPSTYGFIWSVPDLTPNIGLFWYFFTEVFEHFRTFFLWTFQLNAFVYVLPLAICLRKDPILLFLVVLALIAVFKSYPSIGDVALYTSLLPLWKHVFPHMKQYFLIGCIFIACTALAPILWHLWIYANSANANFYFGTTLAFNTGQIFLITDLLFAHMKRRYYIENGGPKELEAKELRLELH
ncbi:phosphatidylinositol glycan anchor biosynthesis class U protein-like isoform X2 [Ornithodoros turicata]|uniref:phosphatidylinositol glycan anchor biosynthesis class U protein-like isoform X2 n=1 Tax=Ornithodoros turicata TaxID=34597 RepID=UPI00313964F5